MSHYFHTVLYNNPEVQLRVKQTIRLINFGIERQVQNGDKVRAFGNIEFTITSFVQIQDFYRN